MTRFGRDLITFTTVQRRKAGLLLAVIVAGAVAGCGGPPALTSRVFDNNLTRSYFDTVVEGSQPSLANETERRLERFIKIKNEADHQILKNHLLSIGANCRSEAINTRCVINRYLTAENCFRGKCEKSLTSWTLIISWRGTTGLINPRARLTISQKNIP